MKIRVGISTAGKPSLSTTPEGLTILHNMRIGIGFHWESCIEAILPGDVTIVEKSDMVINTLPLEVYLECVVGSEMNPCAPIEFLKAHAIISRSWAAGKICCNPPTRSIKNPTALITWEDTSDHSGDPFDVCADDHCQRYQGVQPGLSEAASEAIASTASLILTDACGNPADARFSKCCGGHTELFSTCWQDTDLPYLQAFPDPWCDLSSLDADTRTRLLNTVLKPYDISSREEYQIWREWNKTIECADLQSRIKERFDIDTGNIQNIEVVGRGPSGRISKLKICGKEREIIVGKELTIRRLMDPQCLMSSNFEINIDGDKIDLCGRGWGHGVGLCQVGAARMAAEGASCGEILQFYYPGTKITELR